MKKIQIVKPEQAIQVLQETTFGAFSRMMDRVFRAFSWPDIIPPGVDLTINISSSRRYSYLSPVAVVIHWIDSPTTKNKALF